MFYQVMIEIPDKAKKSGLKEIFELDKTDLAEIEADTKTSTQKSLAYRSRVRGRCESLSNSLAPSTRLRSLQRLGTGV